MVTSPAEYPPAAAVWVLLISTTGAIFSRIVMQVLKSHDNYRKEEQRHRFEAEDRAANAQFRIATAESLAQSAQFRRDMTETMQKNNVSLGAAATQINDGIHRAEVKAEVAYETANHINAKLAGLAKTALKLRQEEEDSNVKLIRDDILNLFHHVVRTPPADLIPPPKAPPPS
jgi:prophage DNA circulation protein